MANILTKWRQSMDSMKALLLRIKKVTYLNKELRVCSSFCIFSSCGGNFPERFSLPGLPSAHFNVLDPFVHALVCAANVHARTPERERDLSDGEKARPAHGPNWPAWTALQSFLTLTRPDRSDSYEAGKRVWPSKDFV